MSRTARSRGAMKIRKATLRDPKVLNDLAVRSEAYWGFDESHMKAFQRTCAIKEDHFRKGSIFVVEKDGKIAGFYNLARKEARS